MSPLRKIFKVFRKDLDCEEVRNASSDYLEANLPVSFMDRVKAHLHECGACAAFVNTLSATVRMLSDIGRTEPQQAPPGFSSRVKERLEAEKLEEGNSQPSH